MLLDLDGTLVDSLADITASVDHVRAAYGLAPLGASRVRAMVGDGAARLLARALADLEPVPPLEELWPRYEAHHEEQCTRLVRPYPGVVDALHRWRRSGVRTAVVTNKPERFSHKLLAGLGMSASFAAICGADTFAFRKPDPRHLTETIAMAGADAGRAVMVGDSRTDIDTAKAAGIPVVAVDFGYTDLHVREFEPSAIISHFNELTVALCERLIGSAKG